MLAARIHPVFPSATMRGSPSSCTSTVGCCVTTIPGASLRSPGVELARAFTSRIERTSAARSLVIAAK